MTESERAWNLLRQAAARARELDPATAASFAVTAAGGLTDPDAPGCTARLHWRSGRWHYEGGDVPALIDLYLPLCRATPRSPLTIGHLGQSLDGYIATADGDSDFVTGPENILHLHRLRALADAVLVGAGTAAADDPQLTTRRVDGENPVRVVLDPSGRLRPTLGLFADDAAPTLLVRTAADPVELGGRFGKAEVLPVPGSRGELDLAALLAALHARGLYCVFVEGGGVTVSRFLEAGLLDRLHIAVAPLLIGRGRPAIRVAGREPLADCRRPATRVFRMGDDVLFDCALGGDAPPLSPA